jgi:hypothetical protein
MADAAYRRHRASSGGNVHSKTIKFGGIAVLVAVLAVASWTTLGAAAPNPTGPQPATQAQAKVFEDLLRREERILFNSMVDGDTSLFATIYYNDPSVPLDPSFVAAIDEAGVDQVNAAIATGQPGPKGAERGFLAGEVAATIVMFRNVTAWEAVAAQAAAEGRTPSADDMPNGETPIPRKSLDEWVDVPFHLFNVTVDEDHATADLDYIDPATIDASYVPWYWEHYTFTRVDGAWYITANTSVTSSS